MTNVKTPSPSLHAGARAVTSAYSLSSVLEYGNARAAERDAYWKEEIEREKAGGLSKDFPPGGGLTECDMGDSYE